MPARSDPDKPAHEGACQTYADLTRRATSGVMRAMLALLSPAKKLDLEPMKKAHLKLVPTQPELLADAVLLHTSVKKLTARQLGELMDLSEALAELNHERFQSWQKVHEVGVNDGKPAALMFAGDVYTGLDAPSLDVRTLTWSQEHLAILSGLYGLLRPLDVIQPYRLEMGSKVVTRRGADLYQFWDDRILHAIERRLAEHKSKVLVNLASAEYMKSVQRKRLGVPIIDVHFREIKAGKPVALMLFAKRARGMMARFIISDRVDRPEGLKDFASEDYRYDASLSGPEEWVFTRPYRVMSQGDDD